MAYPVSMKTNIEPKPELVITLDAVNRTIWGPIVCMVLAIGLMMGLAFGQGTLTSGGRRWSAFQTYDPNTPPPLDLPKAYAMAMTRVGGATNRVYCIAATCLEMTNNGFTGWTFWFSNTNAQRARVDVFFDKEVHVDIQSGEVLRGK